ncbi:MAG: EF-P lysine aminoacylase GenX [Desulfuromonas sp.]|nr:MAG: EF-P lysine aminoacylase GenX [Desulfuromonas sp.]
MQDPNWAIARKRELLEQRARIVQTIRAFFVEQGFLEVETPQRIPANAPELHIDPLPSGSWWLQTSPELAMKRLLAAGYGDIFQLCRVWRAGERGARHLPEFTLLEWYRDARDYTALMDDCEALLSTLIPAARVSWQGEEIDLTRSWPRLSVDEAFARYASCSMDEALSTGRFDVVMSLEIEPRLGNGPVFLCDYPLECGALARRKPGDETRVERFELYLGGLELANAFSELCDPDEQRRRFESERALREADGKPGTPLPEPFLKELSGLQSAAGIALGVDRLVMLLTDAPCIDEVVCFPPELL